MTYAATLYAALMAEPRITYWNDEQALIAAIRSKAAMNNKRDGRAVFTLAN